MGQPLAERTEALVQRSELSDASKALLLRFKDHCIANGLGIVRVAKYLWQLRKLGAWLGGDFERVTMDDMRRVVARIETMDGSPHTKSDHKIALRVFYRWLAGGELPDLVRWIKARPVRGRHIMPTQLLTDEDVRRLIAAADHPRDRAFVAMLYESGARVGEMLALRFQDLVFDRHGVQVSLNGKTGPRRIRLIVSVPYLAAWVNVHPRSHNPAASLWVTRTHRSNTVTYARLRHVLQRLKQRAGISKPVNPHHFRHSRATLLANHLTEAQMKEYLGWVQSSSMAAVYVHLSGRDVDNAILRLNGIAVDDAKAAPSFALQPCTHCGASNPPTHRFCAMCSGPLGVSAAIAVDDARAEWDRKMGALLANDEVRTFLARKLRELEGASAQRAVR